ncbi:hypothetical protein Tco_0424787 [Tanacetum coccineum]
MIALDSPYLLVLITGVSKQTTRYPVDTSLIHKESRKSPTAELFDVDSGRISIHHYNGTKRTTRNSSGNSGCGAGNDDNEGGNTDIAAVIAQQLDNYNNGRNAEGGTDHDNSGDGNNNRNGTDARTRNLRHVGRLYLMERKAR